MKNKLKELEDRAKEQQKEINKLNKQMKRQKWMNVYLQWNR
jgi:uncharacterized coiled-coil protein SlyX